MIYHCKCIRCEYKHDVKKTTLENKSDICNCRYKKYQDLTGQQFGKLTALSTEDDRYKVGKIYWKCLCECGNEHYANSEDLTRNKINSCGCSKFNNLINKTFGKLKVLEYLGTINGRTMWKCLCECGNYHESRSDHLVSGGTSSCGCTKSKAESIIKQILDENKIEYIHDQIFDGLVSDSNYSLRFDFAIYKEDKIIYMIEYDGIQHFEKDNRQSDYEFDKIKYHDRLKNEYCLNNDIKLIRIPYIEFDNLCLELLLLNNNKYLYTKETLPTFMNNLPYSIHYKNNGLLEI